MLVRREFFSVLATWICGTGGGTGVCVPGDQCPEKRWLSAQPGVVASKSIGATGVWPFSTRGRIVPTCNNGGAGVGIKLGRFAVVGVSLTGCCCVSVFVFIEKCEQR